MKFKLGDKVKVVNIHKTPIDSVKFVADIIGYVACFALNHQGFKYDYTVVFRINGVSYECMFHEKELEYANV